jgi:hypothetical protein
MSKPYQLIYNLSKADIEDSKNEEGQYTIYIMVSLDDLIGCGGIEGMNNLLDEHLEDAKNWPTNNLLSDISYEAVDVVTVHENKSTGIVIQVYGYKDDINED